MINNFHGGIIPEGGIDSAFTVDVASCKKLLSSCTKDILKSLNIHEVVQTTNFVGQCLSNDEATVVRRFFSRVLPRQCYFIASKLGEAVSNLIDDC